ncbi:MAG: hypothetical protein LBS60_08975 [Deltaproteobacteria bacterium]|nr:hypothetical protein [Deltaproteobacteria bacterium]
MSKLNVKITDKVFVIGQGYGTVTKVLSDGGFVVKVEGRGEQHYSAIGTLGSAKDQRIFWQDPFVVTPPNNTRLWKAYVRLTTILFNELMELDKTGNLHD